MAAAEVAPMEEEQLPNAALAAAASFLDRTSEGKKFYGMDAELVQKVRVATAARRAKVV